MSRFEGRGRNWLGSRRQEHRNRVPEFCSGYIVQFRHQRRFPHFAEMLGCSLREREPVVPIAQRVLYALTAAMNFSPLSPTARRTQPHSVHACSGYCTGTAALRSPGTSPRLIPSSIPVATAKGSRLASGLKFFPARFSRLRISRTPSRSTALRSFFSCCARNSIQTIRGCAFPPWFLRDLRTAQGGLPHVEIAHFAGALATSSPRGQQLFRFPSMFGARVVAQKNLEPARTGAETVTFCARGFEESLTKSCSSF